MILFEEALAIIEKTARPISTERVSLMDCSGRILAEDIYSDMDMPPFDKSAVDGYACRQSDLGVNLRVLEVIPAGKVPQFKVGQGECSKLMTGGMLPEGADMVIMIEDVETVSAGTIRFIAEKSASNICMKAEDIQKGSRVLDAGTLLRPQEIAVLASVGAATPLVFNKFRIGIITTGDELVEPHQVPGPSQIRNSNAWQLIAQIGQSNAIANYYGIAIDDETSTLALIEKASAENDIVILTGGISVGDFDFVPAVLEKAGFNLLFRSLAVQPGKPSIFATRNHTYVFALPGNPVSGFVQFELLVKHLMNYCVADTRHSKILRLPLGFDYRRKRTDRKAFVPIMILSDGTIGKVDYHGSAHIHSYIHADGFMAVELGVQEILKGSLADVRLL
ncbi:MAG: molybdopterin molybdotransferase MoeA [Bacteroidales bacterium]|nr:molybdopterin molybdotransferase MoeA [Bacteroidales bacterium]